MPLAGLDLEIIKSFWEDEVLAQDIYSFLGKKSKEETFFELAQMEKKHAEFWARLANERFGVKLTPGLKLRIKKLLNKVLATITPITFMIYYLEFGEKDATISYSNMLSKLKDEPELYKQVKEIIIDEIKHESELAKKIMGEESKIAKVKDAIYGMTDSLVEILALVIGLAGVISNPLAIGLAGLISSIGGTFSMTSGAYLSAKSQNDVYKGSLKEIEAKRIIMPEVLAEDLREALENKGANIEVIEKIVEAVKEDPTTLETLTKSLSISETPTNPKEVATTTGLYYILGALPAITPFFIGHWLSIDVIYIAIISVLLASIISFLAGIFAAILSGSKIGRKALENVAIILGATLATYTIGKLATTLLGIQV
ncbi:MAG: VIT1/CCC1 transporter family protein [Candidatus Njordarchaeales archaeon]